MFTELAEAGIEAGNREKDGERREVEDDIPVFVPVNKAGHHGVRIGASAYEEENDEKERLKVEDGSLSMGLGG